VNIRLDPEIVSAFKQSGAGWQTKINEALKDWLKTHSLISKLLTRKPRRLG
jgi:uncharacterized protein (DUF4415 family)